MKSKFAKGFWKYLSGEIAIEYKACLYFFCILFFYCVYRLCLGVYSAGILHMGEIIFTTYFMGYLQVYGLHNFDEAEHIGKREVGEMLLCTGLYTVTSFYLEWFERNKTVTVLFFCYMLFGYWCAYLINKIKRSADTENLNKMLEEFKKGEGDGR